MQALNDASRLKRQILIKVIKAFKAGTLQEDADKIPVEMRPRNCTPSRCCVYRDRAILKYRVMAAMGISVESEKDESLPLHNYVAQALNRKELDSKVLSVLDIACESCVRCHYLVTNACRGCLARPCTLNCPVNAISIKNGAAIINNDKCINCGKCMAVCPFRAIIHVPVPCEEACPFDAIKRNSKGTQYIDYDLCTSCGKCMPACPFGAVLELSQIIDVLKAIKEDKRVVAMMAPSIIKQFPGSLGQIGAAILHLGFYSVEEVATGAEVTTKNETEEFIERMEKGDHIMTSSCCPAYVETVKKHVPEMAPFVSAALSPMKYTAAMIKEKDPEAVTVFIGPCIAKRKEAIDDLNTDYTMTFEELGAMLVAEEIEVAAMEAIDLGRPADEYARGFATSCGVSAAILNEKQKREAASGGNDKIPEIKANAINGLTKKSLNQLKLYAKGKLPGNLLEVMACEGGCVGGPCAIGQIRLNKVDKTKS